jgi:hypothetical protein
MNILVILYALNATLLLLHEIESGYEREWELLKIPGGVTGFLAMHVPIILVLLYGLLEIDRQTSAGSVIGIIAGAGGLVPFLVHKIFVKREGRFSLAVSSMIIYLNLLTGIATMALSARMLA